MKYLYKNKPLYLFILLQAAVSLATFSLQGSTVISEETVQALADDLKNSLESTHQERRLRTKIESFMRRECLHFVCRGLTLLQQNDKKDTNEYQSFLQMDLTLKNPATYPFNISSVQIKRTPKGDHLTVYLDLTVTDPICFLNKYCHYIHDIFQKQDIHYASIEFKPETAKEQITVTYTILKGSQPSAIELTTTLSKTAPSRFLFNNVSAFIKHYRERHRRLFPKNISLLTLSDSDKHKVTTIISLVKVISFHHMPATIGFSVSKTPS